MQLIIRRALGTQASTHTTLHLKFQHFSLDLPVHVSTAIGKDPEYICLMLYNKGDFLFTFKAVNM